MQLLSRIIFSNISECLGDIRKVTFRSLHLPANIVFDNNRVLGMSGLLLILVGEQEPRPKLICLRNLSVFISAGAVEFIDIKRKKIRPDNLRVAQSIFEEFLVLWTMHYSSSGSTILLSRRKFPKSALRNPSILWMKSKNSELFVTYCLISITGAISQKDEESPVEKQYFDENLPPITN